MLQLINGGKLVEHASELPNLTNVKELFCDFETTSMSPSQSAFNAYKGHRAAGICITADDIRGAWYVPLRHHFTDGSLHPGNVDLVAGLNWFRDCLRSCRRWVNQNVKFDMHFAAEDGCTLPPEVYDTLTMSKIFDSDRLYKGGYGLDALSKAWLGEDISAYGAALADFLAQIKLPRRKKAQDYGLIPPDIMAPYGCQDVLTTRKLYRYLQKHMPDDCKALCETEQKLTYVLYDIEREGMHVDPQQLQVVEVQVLAQLLKIEEEIHHRIGFTCMPSAPGDCFEVLCNYYGLPVLSWNDEGNPSFDKFALMDYLKHPEVVNDEERTVVIEKMMAYRKLHTLLTFFVRPYQEHEVDGIMHPDYNQAVRSGRLSCKRPNAQQLNTEAKGLILPPPGCGFLSCDYSQIEFRLMVHVIKDVEAIRAYRENPDIDFHQWVADMCGIPRRPAKNVNFAIGFGAGKRRVLRMLMGQMELMENLEMPEGMDLKSAFEMACMHKASEVYETYHSTLPGIKTHSNTAARAVRRRGYVFNVYGRRAHLPPKVSHLAFNRVIQGTAADIMKERTVAIAPRYNERSRELGLRLCASVHDETLFACQAPTPELVKHVVSTLESPSVEFRVPIRTSVGWSTKNWAQAGQQELETKGLTNVA